MVTVELHYLYASTALALLMWIPYVLNRVMVLGLADTVGYPAAPKPLAPWAERLKKAHANHLENLVPFAALVLGAHAIGVSTAATTTCAAVFFWSRVVHALAYTFAVPWLRTLAFTAGWAAMLCILAAMHGPIHAAVHG
jgi:uncharacterized MAPEG superfamily protein